MSTSYTVTVVWGIKEDEALLAKRTSIVSVPRHTCPNGHPRLGAHPPPFCSTCGGAVTLRNVKEPCSREPWQVYPQDRVFETQRDTVILGVKVLERDLNYSDAGATPLVVPPALQAKCRTFLDAIGYGHVEPALWLITCVC